MKKEYKMWINGKWAAAESGKTYPVFNPATEEEIAQIPSGGKAEVDKAVEAARKAFPIWSKKSQLERSQICLKIAAALKEHHDELAALDVMEHGTPAKRADFIAADLPEWFEWAAYSARQLMGQTVPNSPDELDYLQREPVGVVAIITPWNYPLLMIVEKLAPALVVGNTCVIKPPSIDALTALKLAEILDTIGLPPGTVNVITGPGRHGRGGSGFTPRCRHGGFYRKLRGGQGNHGAGQPDAETLPTGVGRQESGDYPRRCRYRNRGGRNGAGPVQKQRAGLRFSRQVFRP